MEAIISYLDSLWGLHSQMSPWLLLGLLVAGGIGVIFPRDLLLRHLGQPGFLSSLKASLIGIPLPLCSCSVIPTGVGLFKSGVSRGASISFLTSTPQTGVDSIFLTAGVLGLPLALVKLLTSLVTGVISGWWVDRSGPPQRADLAMDEMEHGSWATRWKHQTLVVLPAALGKPYLIGLTLSSALTLLLPTGLVASTVDSPLLQMGLALVISLPLYVCATASVPLALVLLDQGLGWGAVLVFLTAGPASNGATLSVIAKTFGWNAFLRYFLIIVVASFMVGYTLDGWLPAWQGSSMSHHHEHGGWLMHLSGLVLLLLFLLPLIPKRLKAQEGERRVLELEGLTCGGCVAKLTQHLESKGVQVLSMDVHRAEVFADAQDLGPLVEACGFRIKG